MKGDTYLCEQCGSEFDQSRSDHIYCSKTCGFKSAEIRKQQLLNSLKRPKECKYCGKLYNAHFFFGKKQNYCSVNCKSEYHKMAKRQSNESYLRNHPLFCDNCKVSFIGSKKGQRFCSDKCKTDLHAADQRAKREEIRKHTKRSCPICDKTFSPKRSLKEIYCSKRCRESIGKRVYKMMQSCYDSTNTHKENRTHKTLGYSPKQLLEHLQSFEQWDQLKHGQWHLDHKFPIVAFTRKGIKDIKLICCLENLQPLSGSRNCSKGDNYDEAEFETWLAAQN